MLTMSNHDHPDDDPETPVVDWDHERRARGLPAAPLPPDRVLDEARLEIEGESATECRHSAIGVNLQQRKVHCRKCQAEVDPVLLLHQYAIKERVFLQHKLGELRERQRLTGEVEALQRQRVNLKSAINRDLIAKESREANALAAKNGAAAAQWQRRYEYLHAQLMKLGRKPEA